MAIPSNKPQNRILLVGGILFALLAGVVVYLAVSKTSTPATNSTPTVSVVVAATNIEAGSQLTASNLVVHPYLVQDQPAGSYAATNQLIGKIVPVAVSAGTPITAQLLTTHGCSGHHDRVRALHHRRGLRGSGHPGQRQRHRLARSTR